MERWRNSLNSGDGLRSVADTSDATTDARVARVGRLMAGVLATRSPEARGNTLRGGEGSQPTDATDDGRGDPVVRAFGAHALGLIRSARQLPVEQLLPMPATDRQPETE